MLCSDQNRRMHPGIPGVKDWILNLVTPSVLICKADTNLGQFKTFCDSGCDKQKEYKIYSNEIVQEREETLRWLTMSRSVLRQDGTSSTRRQANTGAGNKRQQHHIGVLGLWDFVRVRMIFLIQNVKSNDCLGSHKLWAERCDQHWWWKVHHHLQ